jgi:acyl carrier protein
MTTGASTRSVAERFREIVEDQLGLTDEDPSLVAETTFDALHCDSLDRIELFMACEETFGIEIPDDDAAPLTTFGAAVAYLERRTHP